MCVFKLINIVGGLRKFVFDDKLFNVVEDFIIKVCE